MASGIALAAGVTRLLGIDGYGEYSVAMSVVAVGTGLSYPGVTQALQLAASRGHSEYVRKAIRVRSIASTIVSLVAVGFDLSVTQVLSPLMYIISAPIFVLYVTTSLYVPLLVGLTDYGRLVRAQAGLAVVGLAGAVGGYAVSGTPVAIVAGQLGSSGIVQALILKVLWSELRAKRPESDDYTPFASRMSIVALASVIETRYEVLVLGALAGTREAGVFAVARLFAQMLKHAWSIMQRLLFVDWARVEPSRMRQSAVKVSVYAVVLTGLMALTLVLARPFVSRLLGIGAEPSGLSTATYLVLAAAVVGVAPAVLETAATSAGRAGLVAKLRLPGIALLVAAGTVGAITSGASGVAGARFLKSAATAAIGAWLFRARS